MADEENLDEEKREDDIPADDEDGEGEVKSGVSPKKKIILIAIPLLILLLGLGGMYMLGPIGGDTEEKSEEVVEGAEEQANADGEKPEETTKGDDVAEGEEGAAKPDIPPKDIYYDLPDILVNINSGGKKQVYLKVLVTLALPDADAATRVENEMPKILDGFQIYLRELTIDEIQGSAGMFRLKEELVERINRLISPSRISDVLFKEMLIQ